MGKRGPAPTPTSQLKLVGSTVPKRSRREEPEPARARPQIPENIPEDEREVWEQFCTVTDGMHVLTVADGFPIERWAHMVVRWRKAAAFVREHGESYEVFEVDKEGCVVMYGGKPVVRLVKPYPEVGVLDRTNAALLKIEQQYGLTPSSRTQVRTDTSSSTPKLATRVRGA